MTARVLLFLVVVAPGGLVAALSLLWLLGWTPRERTMARLTASLFSVLMVSVAWLGWALASGSAVETAEASWFAVGHYHFGLALRLDWLSWPLAMLTTTLTGLVGVFSVRYLHRDAGFFRFFVLLHLFTFGALLVVSAATLDVLLCGWELVGLTSVLLVGFFQERREPVLNALRVFGFYRVADIGLIMALFVLHARVGTSRLEALGTLDTGVATAVGLALLVAAAGKSAQVPFSGWLPRAMEGPTPSSAIFYGAISVHLGAYLLLRYAPVLEQSPIALMATFAVGLVTAILATAVHRAAPDAKTSLAYASMAQLGLVFMEVALGWQQLALAHVIGHAAVRTLQFLRAPSMLHDYHRVHAAAGGHLRPTGEYLEQLLPARTRAWLYRAALDRGYQDAWTDRLVVRPVMALAGALNALEPSGTATPFSSATKTREHQAREVEG